MSTAEASSDVAKKKRIVRRKKPKGSAATIDTNELPSHIKNNSELHHVISTTLPRDYEFEVPKTIWRIERSNAAHVALQLPEGLTMYASAIGDILVKFAYQFQPAGTPDEGERKQPKKAIKSLSVLGDVTYGACCIDDLSARALGCDLLVHYGHSCLVPLTCTVIPCLYVFVEIRVDVQHLVDCVKLTFDAEQRERTGATTDDSKQPTRIIEALVMGTVQFRSAVVDSAERLDSLANNDSTVGFEAIVPQAKPLSPGEVLGCTAPAGLAQMDFQEALRKTRRRQARRNQDEIEETSISIDSPCERSEVVRERVMVFLADGRFHLEAAMISNPSLRALRYDPYSKALTEEKYEIVKMKRIRREAILAVRRILGINSASEQVKSVVESTTGEDIANSVLQSSSAMTSPSQLVQPRGSHPVTIGIILGTLGRQGNPAILARIRSLLHSRGLRTMIVLLSEIFPQKLEMLSTTKPGSGKGVSAWVQIACPRLSIDWGHFFVVPVLSPFELYVTIGEVVDPSLWSAGDEEKGYPMDFYSKTGGPWANYFDNKNRKTQLSYGS
mmetsp:Transcript_33693/g.80593  ORF Transcript_33693/g.80593 Transcript_33693/m.80593 type:complete len:557 (+) Transcript_33693:159-1829(+)